MARMAKGPAPARGPAARGGRGIRPAAPMPSAPAAPPPVAPTMGPSMQAAPGGGGGGGGLPTFRKGGKVKGKGKKR